MFVLYKDELIRLHQLLGFVMKLMTDRGVPEIAFEKYRSAGITPSHVEKTKCEHEYAVLVLASEIASVLAKSHESISKGIPARFEELAEKTKEKCRLNLKANQSGL
jgi:hypothetical protein